MCHLGMAAPPELDVKVGCSVVLGLQDGSRLTGTVDNFDCQAGVVFLSRATCNDKAVDARSVCVFTHAIAKIDYTSLTPQTGAVESAATAGE